MAAAPPPEIIPISGAPDRSYDEDVRQRQLAIERDDDQLYRVEAMNMSNAELATTLDGLQNLVVNPEFEQGWNIRIFPNSLTINHGQYSATELTFTSRRAYLNYLQPNATDSATVQEGKLRLMRDFRTEMEDDYVRDKHTVAYPHFRIYDSSDDTDSDDDEYTRYTSIRGTGAIHGGMMRHTIPSDASGDAPRESSRDRDIRNETDEKQAYRVDAMNMSHAELAETLDSLQQRHEILRSIPLNQRRWKGAIHNNQRFNYRNAYVNYLQALLPDSDATARINRLRRKMNDDYVNYKFVINYNITDEDYDSVSDDNLDGGAMTFQQPRRADRWLTENERQLRQFGRHLTGGYRGNIAKQFYQANVDFFKLTSGPMFRASGYDAFVDPEDITKTLEGGADDEPPEKRPKTETPEVAESKEESADLQEVKEETEQREVKEEPPVYFVTDWNFNASELTQQQQNLIEFLRREQRTLFRYRFENLGWDPDSIADYAQEHEISQRTADEFASTDTPEHIEDIMRPPDSSHHLQYDASLERYAEQLGVYDRLIRAIQNNQFSLEDVETLLAVQTRFGVNFGDRIGQMGNENWDGMMYN